MTKNKIDTKILNKKLMDFVGLEFRKFEVKYGGTPIPFSGYYFKNKYVRKTCPDLVHELDTQLKYLWPRLRELGFMIRYQYSELRDNDTGKILYDWTYYSSIFDMSYKNGLKNHRFDAINPDSPALACALAVEKLIDCLDEK